MQVAIDKLMHFQGYEDWLQLIWQLRHHIMSSLTFLCNFIRFLSLLLLLLSIQKKHRWGSCPNNNISLHGCNWPSFLAYTSPLRPPNKWAVLWHCLLGILSSHTCHNSESDFSNWKLTLGSHYWGQHPQSLLNFEKSSYMVLLPLNSNVIVSWRYSAG